MYVPAAFREDRVERLHALIRAYSFGALVTSRGGVLEASHLPFLLDDSAGPNGTLLAHMAKANPQWTGFEEGIEAMVIFEGPHGYISPAWYRNSPAVPTWNYAVVHAYGCPAVIQDRDRLKSVVTALVEQYEANRPDRWQMDLPAGYLDSMLNGIVGFEIPIQRLVGKQKLSQNRPAEDQEGAIRGLQTAGRPEAAALADLMAASLAEQRAESGT